MRVHSNEAKLPPLRPHRVYFQQSYLDDNNGGIKRYVEFNKYNIDV